jgi:hypothetical protein
LEDLNDLRQATDQERKERTDERHHDNLPLRV